VILRQVGRVGELMERFGVREGLRLAAGLRRGRGPVWFTDRGRRYVMPNDRSTSHHLLESTAKLRELASYVRPSDRVIVDVGAHAGLFATFAKERAPAARVICIEPDASLEPLIAANLAAFRDWEVITAAAVDKPGIVTFYRSAVATQESSIHRAAVERFHRGPDPLQVRGVTLDDVCADHAMVDVLKVDVQGAESLVLAGAAETMRKTRTVLIEVTFLDPDPVSVLAKLQSEFGPWETVNVVVSGADLAFERRTPR
jgi:FkbM family methyltransferase